MGRDRTRPALPEFRTWVRDDAACEQALLRGDPVEVDLTGYGANDYLLEFLVGSGLWATLTGMEPDRLKKENGKPWRALNGVQVLRELAGIGQISGCGKVIRDTRLMIAAGFNAEAVTRAGRKAAGLLDPETLANHLGRISRASAVRTFIEHVRDLKKRRWISGSVYAVDAHEIIVPYGRQSERLGKVGDKYGYKLVLLLNITPGGERIVGFAIAPLWASERTMLKRILRRGAAEFGDLSKWIKILVMDRGYWGAEFLSSLKRTYGMDYVTRLQHEELEVTQEVRLALKEPSWRWSSCREERSRLGTVEVRYGAVPHVPWYDEHGVSWGTTNVVVAEEWDLQGTRLRDPKTQEIRETIYYATSLSLKSDPYGIRKYYLSRWSIENQGFRELTQRWQLDRLAGRTWRAIVARIAFVLMLYNAEHILREKYPGPWSQEREELRRQGDQGLIGGLSVATYTPSGQLGLMTPDRYRRLLLLGERRAVASRIRQAMQRGESLDSLLSEFSDDPPQPPK